MLSAILFHSTVGAIIIKLGYGEQIYKDHGKELVELNVKRMRMITTVFAKLWLVDIWPQLKHIPVWFPGAKFRRIGQEGTILGKKVRYWAFGMAEKAVVRIFTYTPLSLTQNNDREKGLQTTRL